MNEDFLHYIWQQELFSKKLRSVDGDDIEIISTGMHNTDAGPDFSNARIRLNGTIWAGNIEIHIDSADWEKHRHHQDPAYNNVILHVVGKFTRQAFRSNGEVIPTVILEYDPSLFERYQHMVGSNLDIPCQADLKKVDDFSIKLWLESLSIERIEEKSQYIQEVMSFTNNNWEETFYISLARNFGFKTNALPFELMAKATPQKLLAKYGKNLHQLEALLFGQAGLLSGQGDDAYYQALQKEYGYFQKIHSLKPIDGFLWKYLRLRPSNFPTIRLAQFAHLAHSSEHLFSKTIEAKTLDELNSLYDCHVSDYWKTHYTFGKTSKNKTKNIGKTALQGLYINTIIPFLFIYGKSRGKEYLVENALHLLSEIPAESNAIIKNWANLGIVAENAAQSQALIQLKNSYCIQKNCLYCQIGNAIIRNKINEAG